MTRLEPITVDDTIKIIKKINVNKATGIDEIPIKVIKAATTALAKPITTLMNLIFSTRQIPQELKTAVVTPTFKSGDQTKVDNYRPLSVLPATSKIMEYHVKDKLYDYLEKNNLITDAQHAYRTGHSTATCLLKLTEDIRIGMDEGKATGILAIDLSKAFDVIDHEIMMTKLRNIGITGQLLDFIRDYLRDRLQCVKHMSNISDKQEVTHGVPQGSILGPLLFMIYMNDLKDVVEYCNMVSYADDTTIYYTSKHPSNIQVAINSDIKRLEKWFTENKMKLNVSKTEFMIIQPQNTENRYRKIHITMKKKIIEHSDNLKILGITLNKTLKWDTHINEVIRGCKYHLRAFRRTASYLNIDERKLLYNACIASRLAYGDVIWKETTEALKNRLQVIQNDAARAIFSKKPRTSAKPLLKDLRWMTLYEKRKMHSEVLLHKIINGEAPRSLQNMLQTYKRPTNDDRQRRNDLYIPAYRTNSMANSFFITTIKSWNKIPHDLKMTKKSQNFKARLNTLYVKN